MHQPPDEPLSDAPMLGYAQGFNQRYLAGWRLGKGAYGMVYTATHRATGKKCAVKCIPKVLPRETPEREREAHLRLVETEIEILKLLKGVPTVIQFEDVFEDDTKIFLVTELCKGGSLDKKKSKVSERALVRYLRSVFQALIVFHANGIIHRDIKPENFLLTSKDKRAELRTSDFGIAARFSPGNLPVDDLGHPCGTIFYMAPEVCKAKWYDVSDVWSAGIMAAYMLTGTFPFTDPETPEDPDPTRTFRSIRNDEFKTTGSEWSKISPLAQDFIRHLLVKDHRHRPMAAQALQHPFLTQNIEPMSEASSMASSANVSLDPMADDLSILLNEGVEPVTLAKRLEQFSMLSRAASGSTNSLMSLSLPSPNVSLDPTSTEELSSLGFITPSPSSSGEKRRESLLKRIFRIGGSAKKESIAIAT